VTITSILVTLTTTVTLVATTVLLRLPRYDTSPSGLVEPFVMQGVPRYQEGARRDSQD
jgi:hypothetical protein